MSLTIIAAADFDWGIGRDNTIPWRLSDDMKRFKALTENKIVVMGRKTWDSLPKKPLPNRQNWVMSFDNSLTLPDGVRQIQNVNDVLKASEDQDVVIIGGEQIYKVFIWHADFVELTGVHTHIKDCDAYFPESGLGNFSLTDEVICYKDEKNEFDYTYLTFKRI